MNSMKVVIENSYGGFLCGRDEDLRVNVSFHDWLRPLGVFSFVDAKKF